MNNNRLNLIYQLNHIANENSVGTVEFELANYFLINLKNVSNWNIYGISEDRHVSRASVRRFAKQLGYQNFLDMKKDAETFDDGIHEFQEFYGYIDFLPKLQTGIVALMEELNFRFNTEEINRLIQMIDDSENVIILCSSNITGSVKTFQQRMIIFEKKITLLTKEDDLAEITGLYKNPLVIIFSISGLFLSSLLGTVKKVNAKKVLFTNNRNPIYNKYFDKLYHLSSQIHHKEFSELLYYTYGIDFVLDLLLNGYLLKYKKKREG